MHPVYIHACMPCSPVLEELWLLQQCKVQQQLGVAAPARQALSKLRAAALMYGLGAMAAQG